MKLRNYEYLSFLSVGHACVCHTVITAIQTSSWTSVLEPTCWLLCAIIWYYIGYHTYPKPYLRPSGYFPSMFFQKNLSKQKLTTLHPSLECKLTTPPSSRFSYTYSEVKVPFAWILCTHMLPHRTTTSMRDHVLSIRATGIQVHRQCQCTYLGPCAPN